MKSITTYITEALRIKSGAKITTDSIYKYFPKTKEDLIDIIDTRIREEGNEVNLNDIDTSEITDMSSLFYLKTDFNGDISNWDVSNVTNMNDMFYKCVKFNCNILNWNVSNVTKMHNMFYRCKKFNCDLSNWDVSNVKNMYSIFYGCYNFEGNGLQNWKINKELKSLDYMFNSCKKFNCDISNWNVSNVISMYGTFYGCESFNQDISNWDVSNVDNYQYIFDDCIIEEKYKPKFK